MRALVTGASGFTGGYMVENLINHGYSVRAFIRPTSDISRLRQLPVELSFGTIESKDDLLDAMNNIDIVFHLAAMYRSASMPDSVYWDVNVTGTENVMQAAAETGVKRVLLCSTCGVHGHIDEPPADENAPMEPGDIYQETKVEAERIANFYFKEKGVPVTIVRPVGIYGPGDLRMLKMYRLINDGKFIMFGDGNVLYHLTYVTDTVEGFRLAAESETALGQTYIIAGERYTTLNRFAEMIAEAVDVKPPRLHLPVWPMYALGFLCEKVCVTFRIQPPIFRRRVDIFTKDRAFDITKAKRDLNFQPMVDMEQGIYKTAQWYFEKGLLESKS